VDEAKTLSKTHEVGVELVEFVAKSTDGKLYKVTALINGAEEAKIKTTVTKMTTVVDNFDSKSQKTIRFFSEPEIDKAAMLQKTQGTKTTGAAISAADDAKVGAKATENTSVTQASKATADNGVKDQAKAVKGRKISAAAAELTAEERYSRLKQPKVMTGYIDRYGDTRKEVKDFDPRVLDEARRIRAEELPDLSIGSFKRNVAVVRVKIDGKERIIGSVNDPNALHSEQQILKTIEKEVGPLNVPGNRKRVELLEVYSEREPCAEMCSKHLKTFFPNAKIYYTMSEEWTVQRAKELRDRWLGAASASTASP
jgi:hypothetical protein